LEKNGLQWPNGCAGAEETMTSSTSGGFWEPPVTVPDHGEMSNLCEFSNFYISLCTLMAKW